MNKSDLHGQIEWVWRRLYLAAILICLTAPPAVIPWFKKMGIVGPDVRFVRWLWAHTPELNQEIIIAGTLVNTSTLVWISLGLFMCGLFYFASKLKHLERLESFRDEAEKRMRIEGYMKKELGK
jgi:hypothetical protein